MVPIMLTFSYFKEQNYERTYVSKPIIFVISLESTACEGYICENGGVCVVTLTVYGVQVPKCSCSLPFVGSLCQSGMYVIFVVFILSLQAVMYMY